MGRASDRDLAKSQAKMAVSGKLSSSLAFLICFLSFVTACSTAEKPRAEAPPSPASATSSTAEGTLATTPTTSQPEQVANKLPPPELKTVEEAVKRVFKEAALVDSTHQPSFVAGDFNGDLSQDLAVVIRPVPDKISEMNAEFPRWLLRDPFASPVAKNPRLSVGVNDELVAVIHGYGPNGWHAPEATQTFLLKNVAGSNMQTLPVKEFAAANQGKKLPQLRGDLVGETIEGKAGYLYYSDATYAWYDPKTFKGEVVQRGMVHGAPKKQTQ